MTPDILLRFAYTIGIILLGLGAYWLVNQRLLFRAKNNLISLLNPLPNKPVIVYFATRPIARRVEQSNGRRSKSS